MDIEALIKSPKIIVTPEERLWKWRRDGRYYKISLKLALEEKPEIILDLHITCAVHSNKISIALVWNRTERIYGIDIGKKQRHINSTERIYGPHKHIGDKTHRIDASTFQDAWTILCEDCNINYEGVPELPEECRHEQGELYDDL